MQTIHRYYQQQLVLRTRQLFFAGALCCLGLAWVLIRGRGLGKAVVSTFFLSGEENAIGD